MMDNNLYYRPIQYLGSKTRVVDTIVSECKKIYAPGEYIVDLFSGSSIVSQSLYKNGMNVIANDVLSFSSDIAASMLNQNRRKTSADTVKTFIHGIIFPSTYSGYFTPFSSFIEQENQLLSEHNIDGLKKLYSRLSQVGNNIKPSAQVEYIRNHEEASAINNVPFFANYYAGTYFGIKQALDIDFLRNEIEHEWELTGDIWEKKMLLTALYNTCSIIVHSAGKHFAQPISLNNIGEKKIMTARLFENRTYNVIDVFKMCANNILNSTTENWRNDSSFALNMDMCTSKFSQGIKDKKVSIIYADPPYTAQQYSRFYHVLEVLHDYIYPKLQIFRGKYTQGIYPNNKYKSPFCSKTMAKGAFDNIFNLAQSHSSSLIISYSESKNELTGNERMVSLDDIMQLAAEYIPNHSVSQVDFDFDYRQLNTKEKIVATKEDKEILLIFKNNDTKILRK